MSTCRILLGNDLIKNKEEPRGRPDRVFYKTMRYQLDSVEVVGKGFVSGAGLQISPHFAVLVCFTALEHQNPPLEPPEVPCFFKRAQWSLNFQQN